MSLLMSTLKCPDGKKQQQPSPRPPVEMRNWRLFPDSEFKAVILYGVNVQTRVLVNTSPIAERLAPDLVRTQAGSTIRLAGPSRRDEMAKVFTASFVDLFWDGFPENWLDLVEKELERLAKAPNRAEISRLVNEITGRKLTTPNLNDSARKMISASKTTPVVQPLVSNEAVKSSKKMSLLSSQLLGPPTGLEQGAKRVLPSSPMVSADPELEPPPEKRPAVAEIRQASSPPPPPNNSNGINSLHESRPESDQWVFQQNTARKLHESGENRQNQPESPAPVRSVEVVGETGVEDGDLQNFSLPPSPPQISKKKPRGRPPGKAGRPRGKSKRVNLSDSFDDDERRRARYLYGKIPKGSLPALEKTLIKTKRKKKRKDDLDLNSSSDESDRSIFGIDEEGDRESDKKKPKKRSSKKKKGGENQGSSADLQGEQSEKPKKKPGRRKKFGPEKLVRKGVRGRRPKGEKKQKVKRPPRKPAWLSQEDSEAAPSGSSSQPQLEEGSGPILEAQKNENASIIRRFFEKERPKKGRPKRSQKVDVSKLKTVKKKAPQKTVPEKIDDKKAEPCVKTRKPAPRRKPSLRKVDLSKLKTVKKCPQKPRPRKTVRKKVVGETKSLKSEQKMMETSVSVLSEDEDKDFLSTEDESEPPSSSKVDLFELKKYPQARSTGKCWTKEQYDAVYAGVKKFGLEGKHKWHRVRLAFSVLRGRSNVEVKDAWYRLKHLNEPKKVKPRRKVVPWELKEYKAINEGVQRFGIGRWVEIQRAYKCLARRSNIDVRDAWGRMVINPKLAKDKNDHIDYEYGNEKRKQNRMKALMNMMQREKEENEEESEAEEVKIEAEEEGD